MNQENTQALQNLLQAQYT
jgi:hypothetical protein